jgi:transcriptional regulator with XRE-family HTH domain
VSKSDTAFLRLRRERLARGWTQRDVQLRTQIVQPKLSLIERGLMPYCPPDWKRRLVRVFGLPEEVLLAEDPEAATPPTSA